MNRIMAILLISAMLLASCASESTTDINETTASPDTTTAAETEAETERTATGLEAVDYEGAEINFIIRSGDDGDPTWCSKELVPEGDLGEVLNDAVYRRNVLVEDKYKIKITVTKEGMYDGHMQQKLQNSVNGDEDVYQCAMPSIGFGSRMGIAGLFYDMNSLENLDFTAPWWDVTLNETMTAFGRRYYAEGSMNLLTNDGTAAILFNKDNIKEYKLEDPYELVRSGKWTIDKYRDMTVEYSYDLNSDGIMNQDDFWGSVSCTDSIWALVASCGYSMGYKNENDEPVFRELDEKYVSILEKIAAVSNVGKTFNSLSAEFNPGGGRDPMNSYRITGSGRSIFHAEVIYSANLLRDYEGNFGMIPFPKYDEAQENYICPINVYASTSTAIPVTVRDTDRITRILEDMSCESRNILWPAYYEITLQGKLTRDEESIGMLDVIFKNRIMDFGLMHNFGNVQTDGIANEIVRGTNNFASSFEKLAGKAQADVEKLIEAYNPEE